MLPDTATVTLDEEIASFLGQGVCVSGLLAYGGRGARILSLFTYTAGDLLFSGINFVIFIYFNLWICDRFFLFTVASTATRCNLLGTRARVSGIDRFGSLCGRTARRVCGIDGSGITIMFAIVRRTGVGVVWTRGWLLGGAGTRGASRAHDGGGWTGP